MTATQPAAGALAEPPGAGTERVPAVAPGRAPRLGRVFRLARPVGYAVAVAIVVAVAVRAARDVRLGELAAWWLAPAFAGVCVWWFFLARGWALVVSGRAYRSDVGDWFRTQALRYLPGGIWAPASRATIVRGGLVDRLATVTAEHVAAVCAALALAGVAFAAAGCPAWVPLVLLAPVPAVAARFVRGGRTRVAPGRLLRATGNDALGFAAYAAAAVCVQTAVSGAHEPFAVAGAALVAWAAGLVAVFAPGGVGVREVVYVALLSQTLGTGDPAVAAVTLRVVAIAAELCILVPAGRPVRARRPVSVAAVDGGGRPSP